MLFRSDLRTPVRLLGVTALSLTDEPVAVQQSLFAAEVPKPDPRREALELELDLIRKKYGRNAIGGGYLLHNDIGLEELAIRPEDAAGDNDNDDGTGRQLTKGPLGKK